MSDESVEPLKRKAYSIAQAAEVCGLSYDEIRKAVNGNEMDVRRRGRKVLIPVHELDRWFEALPDSK